MQLWLMLLLSIHQTENIGSLCLDSGFAVPTLSFVNQEAWLSSKYQIYKRVPNIFLLGFVLLLLCTCAVEEGFQLRPPRHHCPSAHASSVRPSVRPSVVVPIHLLPRPPSLSRLPCLRLPSVLGLVHRYH